MKLTHIPRATADLLLLAYQKSLSPDHGPLKGMWPHGFCPQSPSCSAYARNVIREKGVIRGIPLSLWHVLKCNPFRKPDENRMKELAGKMLSGL